MQNKFTHITFDEWRIENDIIEDALSGTSIVCPSCEGEGAKHCFECRHDSDCEICLGNCEVPYDSLPFHEQTIYLKSLWNIDKKESQRKLDDYLAFMKLHEAERNA